MGPRLSAKSAASAPDRALLGQIGSGSHPVKRADHPTRSPTPSPRQSLRSSRGRSGLEAVIRPRASLRGSSEMGGTRMVAADLLPRNRSMRPRVARCGAHLLAAAMMTTAHSCFWTL
jgi:hypothetical protein